MIPKLRNAFTVYVFTFGAAPDSNRVTGVKW
jgi:hypothetical protein